MFSFKQCLGRSLQDMISLLTSPSLKWKDPADSSPGDERCKHAQSVTIWGAWGKHFMFMQRSVFASAQVLCKLSPTLITFRSEIKRVLHEILHLYEEINILIFWNRGILKILFPRNFGIPYSKAPSEFWLRDPYFRGEWIVRLYLGKPGSMVRNLVFYLLTSCTLHILF